MNKKKIIILDKTDSTNRHALANFAKIDDGTLILAREQSSGRGRRGRKWVSPPGNIYASFVIKRKLHPAQLTFIGALSALGTLRQYAPALPIWLKWPNDVFVKSLKIAGILSETHSPEGSNKTDGAVIGIGINLNVDKDFFETNNLPGTSVVVETVKHIDIDLFADSLQNNILKTYLTACENPEEIFALWKKENLLLGKEIELVQESGQEIKGVFSDLEKDGSLVLLLSDGKIQKFHSGDVSVKAK